jgi:cyanophycinase-like exopeptidase
LTHKPPQRLERAFDALTLPAGAGALILSGDISGSLDENPILARFVELAGGQSANLLVIADGGASDAANERTAKRYADALEKMGVAASVGNPQSDHQDVTGFIYVGRDASKMTPPEWLREPWLAGKPILADNAAAALMGSFYAAHPPTPTESEEAEAATQQAFWQGKTDIQPGLGLVGITIQPQILADNRFGRWFALAYNHPDQIAIGLNADTAIEITPAGAQVIGQNGIFVLDLRSAQLALGANNGFVSANGLLDVFAPGETIQPEIADVQSVFQPLPTPILNTATETPTAEPSLAATPSAAAAPTQTPTILEPTSAPTQLIPAPASLLPQFWGILIGLVLIVGASLVAKLMKIRK